MKTLEKLFYLRSSLYKYEKQLGLHGLSDIEKSVLEFIIHKHQATITAITKDTYFRDYSLSTIKRAVGVLLEGNFIYSTQSSDDKRVMLLKHSI